MIKYWYDGKFSRRISKGDITFTYDCEGNLAQQSNGMSFFYDSQGVSGFAYGGSNYYYKKDALGNVIAILDATGATVASYEYNAWGEHSISGNTTIGNLNPFRYRSYYYDTETGFYYLQTRYYDPVTCRFLNMDDIDYADPSSIGGLNLYAYCNNDPVNYIDPTGHDPAWWEWLLLGIAAAVIVGAAIVATVATGGTALVACGIAVCAIWDEEVRNDMNAIHWNPFNSDEVVAADSKKFSFYKGVPIIRVSGMGGSMSMGAIFLDKNEGWSTMKHEFGHNKQLMSMGLGNYLIQIGIPSLWKGRTYAPWELSASILGDSTYIVSGSTQEQQDAAMMYYSFAIIPILNLYNIYKYIVY